MPPDTDGTVLAARIERIKALLDELERVQADASDAKSLVHRIKREIDEARRTLTIPKRKGK